jgi:homocysteine S-methyltransferase
VSRLSFQETVRQEPLILTEGAVVERLGREPSISLDPHILHAAMAGDVPGRQVLGCLYRGYLDAGRRHNLSMMVLTPTWRASAVRLARAGYTRIDLVNRQGYEFLAGIVSEYGAYARSVYIGGLMGCVGDAYRPQDALSGVEAVAAHAPQAQALASCGVDFLLASTLPTFSEALGMARAMAECGQTYLLSFVVRPAGTLLDGTSLHCAVQRIDACVSPRPLCYLLNCVHPSIYAQAMRGQLVHDPLLRERVIGLQGNTSCRSPEELEALGYLETEDPQPFADAMLALHQRFGVSVLGGCCGTDERHIECIARGMAESKHRTARLSS